MNKVTSLSEAIRRHLPDGALVFVGGFGHCVPFAAGRELIRQDRRDLVLCRTGADVLFDQLIAAGCARKVIFGYLGNPGVGLAHAFRRAVAEGTIEIEEWTNFAVLLRLHAGRLGVPYLPTRALLAGDVARASAQVAYVACPFTGERLAAVPALVPDVALIHGQRADASGDVQMWGIDGDTREGALAARCVVATVEEIVAPEVVRAAPERTVVPGRRVAAVCEVPWGAHPSYVEGYYGRDDSHFATYDAASRDAGTLAGYLDEWVHAAGGREAYGARLGEALRRRLEADARGRRPHP